MTAGSGWRGLLDSARGIADTGIDFVHTRVQLFGVELEQQLLWARSLIAQAVAAVLLAVFTVGFTGFALVVVFWDSHRELVAILVAGFFALLATVSVIRLQRALAARPQPFKSTLEVLERDANALRGDR
jgi:uncharacterized membrane protein YqjE